MKKGITIIAMALCLITANTSCSKEKIQEKALDLAMQIMTTGVWIVTNYEEGSVTATSQFSGWECQFYSDGKCEARNGTTKVAGTWSASTSSQTITGQFPAGSNPLNKINGTWKIVKSNTTVGEFTQDKSGTTLKMTLTKK